MDGPASDGDSDEEPDVFTPQPAGVPARGQGFPQQDAHEEDGPAGREVPAQDGYGPDDVQAGDGYATGARAQAGYEPQAQSPDGQDPYTAIPHQGPYAEWGTAGGEAYRADGYPADNGYPQEAGGQQEPGYPQEAGGQQEPGYPQGAGYPQQYAEGQPYADAPYGDQQQYPQQQWGYDAYQEGAQQGGAYDPAQYDPYGYGAQQQAHPQQGQDPNHPYAEDQGQEADADRRPQHPDGSSNQ
jgi:hypothetical protein